MGTTGRNSAHCILINLAAAQYITHLVRFDLPADDRTPEHLAVAVALRRLFKCTGGRRVERARWRTGQSPPTEAGIAASGGPVARLDLKGPEILPPPKNLWVVDAVRRGDRGRTPPVGRIADDLLALQSQPVSFRNQFHTGAAMADEGRRDSIGTPVEG